MLLKKLLPMILLFFAVESFASTTKSLPLDNKLKGKASLAFDTEGTFEGLRYLGTTLLEGEPAIYAHRYDNNFMIRFHKGVERVLGEVRGREIRGFGTMERGQYILLTEGPGGQLIEKFNSRGVRIYHIEVTIELDSDDLYTVEFDGNSFYIIGAERGYRVGRFGGQASAFEGFPIFGTEDFLSYDFQDGYLGIKFLPEQRSFYVRIPLFFPPDHVEFFRKTSRGLYFLLETEINMQNYESTFFIYKIDKERVRQVGGLYVSLPYSPRAERSFWFDEEGRIFLTTLEGKAYQVWYVGHF